MHGHTSTVPPPPPSPADSWERQFDALNTIRRVAAHHRGELSSPPALHTAVVAVLGAAESLRSSVAKNGMMALGDLFTRLGRALDGELDTELQDGRKVKLTPGMSYQVSDDPNAHRSSTALGAKLFIVD